VLTCRKRYHAHADKEYYRVEWEEKEEKRLASEKETGPQQLKTHEFER
jgi:hypothetical protein